MRARLASLWLALLVLLGAWHEGVHLLEHALHAHPCPHEASAHDHHGHHHGHDHAHGHDHDHADHADHAPVGSDGGPLIADPAHAGHDHHCVVCWVPSVDPSTGDADARGPEPALVREWACLPGEASSHWLEKLPLRRGPPLLS